MTHRTPHRSSHRTPRLGLVALCLAALAGWAQATPASAPAAGMGPQSAQAPHHGGHRHLQERLARHLEALKGKLQLTAAQEGAWTAFASALQARPAHAADMAQQHQELQRLGTPERLDRMKELRTQRQAQMNSWMEQRSEATRRFYAALSAEQKKVFDAETARHLPGSGRHGHHGHG